MMQQRFLPDTLAISIVLQTGEIAVINTESPPAWGPLKIEGSIEGGASAARWSPDMELLAIITASRNLLLMTKEWDVLYETPIPESVPYAALCVARVASFSIHLLFFCSSTERNSISWRADGQFLVTNVLSTPHPPPPAVATPKGPNDATKRDAASPAVKRDESPFIAPRILHVWERNGVLHSTGDRPGAPPPLAPGRRAPPRPPHAPESLLSHVVYRYVRNVCVS